MKAAVGPDPNCWLTETVALGTLLEYPTKEWRTVQGEMDIEGDIGQFEGTRREADLAVEAR